MTLRQALSQTRSTLSHHHIEEAAIEGELLLRHALKISRVQLYTDPNCELSQEQEENLQQLISRRLNGEPAAYITGNREFFSLDFYVDPGVLIPRPETELLVEKAISIARSDTVTSIADIGTGCGAIAVSLAMNLPGARIYATDISAPALKVARLNCQKHGVAERIHLLEGDLLDPLPEPVDLLVANLPYVREADLTRPLSFEPRLALNGGPDGLEQIRRLCHQVGGRLRPQGYLLLEIGQGQGKAVSTLLRRLFPTVQTKVSTDFNGIERVFECRLTQDCPDAKIALVLSPPKSKSRIN